MFRPRSEWIREVALLCCVLMVPGDVPLMAQEPAPAPAAPAEAPAAPVSPDQLDSLVAPIALYPDPLLTGSGLGGVHLSPGDRSAAAVAG